MIIRNPGFIKALLEGKKLGKEQYEELRNRFQTDDSAICKFMISSGQMSETECGEMWATGFGLAWMALRESLFQPEIVARLPRSFADRHKIIPIYKFGDRITAAVADPTDRIVVDRAEQLCREKFSLVCAFREHIDDAIEIQYGSVDGLMELSEQVDLSSIVAGGGFEISRDDLTRIAGDQAVVQLVRAVLLLAIKENASDVHVAPRENKVSIRFRVDGVLQERMTLGTDVHAAMIARIKVLSELNIAEHRRPQDGRTQLKLASRTVDVRVSIIPSVHGERVVLRILSDTQAKGIPALDDIGFSKRNLTNLRRLSGSPNGILFVVGPTGSGKTTSLFSVLNEINRPEINILTIEDPVEYRLDGASQLQVNSAIGLDFKAALRAFLRQDPDVILVGEIRDLETAEIAIQASQTGHLVLSTLHTNSALQAVTRLMDLGIEPFNVGASMLGVLSQRLVRRLCDSCKEPYVLGDRMAERIFEPDGKPVTFYRAKGCPSCNYQGYRGRIALHEVLVVDEDLQDIISRGGTLEEMRNGAERGGFQDIIYDGLKKVMRGQTTLEEVDRVTLGLRFDSVEEEETVNQVLARR
ncbi:MAG: GspE/PulE family protein [Gammaproteobacteria bacterium]